MKNKNVLVVGIARSGVSAAKALSELGAVVTISDSKYENEIDSTILKELKKICFKIILGRNPNEINTYDLIVVSPGVPSELPFLKTARKAGIEVVGELELGYILKKHPFIAITGTNGKTTTTSLVGKIFEKSEFDSSVVGNIGNPVTNEVLKTSEETVMVTEVSSFQLETIKNFRPSVSAILNLTPDHLNRHKTFENYANAKYRIFENQTIDDYVILNYDDERLKNIEYEMLIKADIIYFSRSKELKNGVFIKNNNITIKTEKDEFTVCNVDELFIKGNHNIENALAATAITFYSGVSIDDIKDALVAFRGVEHRLEYVDTINNITFYNDSKGTNPNATIQAIKAMDQPTILIAGGMDKGSDFNSLFDSFTNHIKKVILFGETKHIIANCAKKNNFNSIEIVENLDEAFDSAVGYKAGRYNILLSPACASWDMYDSYEHRGNHFKKCVQNFKGGLSEER